jgi:hypothetical protein
MGSDLFSLLCCQDLIRELEMMAIDGGQSETVVENNNR